MLVSRIVHRFIAVALWNKFKPVESCKEKGNNEPCPLMIQFKSAAPPPLYILTYEHGSFSSRHSHTVPLFTAAV